MVVVWLLLFVGACVVDDRFLDDLPCGPEGACAGGKICVRVPCSNGRMCPVCRSTSDIPDGDDGSDGSGDRQDGGDLDGGDSVDCSLTPPPCKKLPECTDVEPQCQHGSWVCDTGFELPEKSCDGIDNDCDGGTDSGLVCVLAGDGTAGFADAAGKSARFNLPRGIDRFSASGVVVADTGNHAIRLVSPDGTVSTLAGTGTSGAGNGSALLATFYNPSGVAAAADGSVVVADTFNDRIRRIAPDGLGAYVVTTEAGGFTGFKDGPVAEARFFGPMGIAVNASGEIFVADSGNNCIRKIAQGTVSTLAGSCGSNQAGFQDGLADAARFSHPTDLRFLADGRLLVSEESNHALRTVGLDGSVATLAGTGQPGFADGPLLQSQFRKPGGCWEDAARSLIYNADSSNHRVRIIGAEVQTFWGSGVPGFDDGPPTLATFRQPCGLAVFEDGRLVIADTHNHALRVVNP